MSTSSTTQVPFADLTDDPAVPGDPFVRLRYHYGQLLGAEDFTLEQQGLVLRRRLHQAVHHGVGTAWGLRVDLEEPTEDENASVLSVQPGLGVDARGRDVYVDRVQCLDVKGLASDDIWSQLEAELDDEGEETGRVIAYIVLRYQACFSQPVPAITPPCGDASDATSYGRLEDSFRIDLDATAPECPNPLSRLWMSEDGPGGGDAAATPRDRLLDYLLGDDKTVGSLWASGEDAPLLLARVLLEADDAQVVTVVAVDNTPRPLLPAVQLVAESLFGQRLQCADAHVPLQVVSWSWVEPPEGGCELRILMSRAVAAGSELSGLRVLRLDAVAGWMPLVADIKRETDDTELVVHVAAANLGTPPEAGDRFHIHLSGSGPSPLIDTDGGLLAGHLADHLPHPGTGRDASIIATWPPTE